MPFLKVVENSNNGEGESEFLLARNKLNSFYKIKKNTWVMNDKYVSKCLPVWRTGSSKGLLCQRAPEFFLALSLEKIIRHTMLCFQLLIFWAAFSYTPVGIYTGMQVILSKGSWITHMYLWVDINISLTHLSRPRPLPNYWNLSGCSYFELSDI